MNIFEIRKANLSILAKEIGGITALAKQLKKSQSQISQLLMNKSTRKIGDKLAIAIEKYFKKPRGWLDLENIQIQYSVVPLIQWNEIINWEQLKSTNHDREFIATQSDVSSNSFSLEILSDTMESPHSISFPKKSIIIVDPEKTAACNSFVITQDGESDAAIFRQLILDGNQIYLKPLNPVYPVIKLNKQPIIYGVVCGARLIVD